VDDRPISTTSDGCRRVLQVINGEHYSGAERVQDLLAQRLPEFGFSVDFACVKPGCFARRRECRQAAVWELPMRARMDMRPVWQLIRIARRINAVLLHAHTPRSLIVARLAAMISGLPVVYHVHSPTARDSTRALRNWLNNTTERLSLRGVDRLITVSRSLAEHMRGEGVEPGRIVTVTNGVPAARCTVDRAIPQGTWTVGTVALFRPRKGFEVLLESIASLRQQAVPVRLRAVGGFESAEYETAMRRRADQLGIHADIDWVGFTRDVDAQWSRMDVFVLPSLFGEGLPMVVLEAMAARVPVIATRVEGVPEAIDDGVEGILVEPSDSAGLARQIRRLIEHPQRWLAYRDRAYQRYRLEFSDRRMAQGVAEVYHGVLADSARPARTESRGVPV
jgi:glycosyltransferase involved in cell wall biosynthesis